MKAKFKFPVAIECESAQQATRLVEILEKFGYEYPHQDEDIETQFNQGSKFLMNFAENIPISSNLSGSEKLILVSGEPEYSAMITWFQSHEEEKFIRFASVRVM